MAFNYISAAEAASLIKHGYNIGLSGFTPAGTAKAVTAELAKIAEAEHAKGNPFQIGIFTGASTGDSCDGILSRAKAIRYRAPYTTNSDFRKAVNSGEIAYNDIHLSQMAQEVRYGFMGKVNIAIVVGARNIGHLKSSQLIAHTNQWQYTGTGMSFPLSRVVTYKPYALLFSPQRH